jgi:hypothetical protein
MKPLYEYITNVLPIVHYGFENEFLGVMENGVMHYFLLLDKNENPISWEKINNKTRDSIGRLIINNETIFGVEKELMKLVRGCHAIGEVGLNNRGYDINNICTIYRDTDTEWMNYTR